MSSAMSIEQREAFLAGVHVGVVSVADDGRAPLARRYLGLEQGDRYVESTEDATEDMIAIRMRPERWLSVDQGK
ncbi:MAG: hypothetical protein GEV03_15905 [Streptosporangiales bacterium]|nr:hypothetical protein [Streptosporangiales bacterium]